MSKERTAYRFLFAGGGTGGHLFPAVAVAEKIKALVPEAEIMFVGTANKIEATVVPQLGYEFKSVWIRGFTRSFNAQTLLFPVRLAVSLIQSLAINMKFKPAVAIGSGGYAAGPAIWGADVMGAKVILLEQNSYPGVTTRILEKYADEVHISFENSKKYFRHKEKLMVTGNPVRESLKRSSREEAVKHFGLDPEKKTLLILGGSLGAGTLNNAASNAVKFLEENNVQVIWQTGKAYHEKYSGMQSSSVKVLPFIDDMNLAYSAADLLVSRAGATTIAEITCLGIPSVLVPSPNVAENHQFHNAKSLSDNNAAVLIEDSCIVSEFLDVTLKTLKDDNKLGTLKENAIKSSFPDAAEIIAKRAIGYINK